MKEMVKAGQLLNKLRMSSALFEMTSMCPGNSLPQPHPTNPLLTPHLLQVPSSNLNLCRFLVQIYLDAEKLYLKKIEIALSFIT